MPSISPKKLVELWVESFNRGNANEIAGFYADNAINHQVAESPVEGCRAMTAAAPGALGDSDIAEPDVEVRKGGEGENGDDFKIWCVECEDVAASVRCDACGGDYMCGLCFQWQHRSGRRAQHKPTLLPGSANAQIDERCSVRTRWRCCSPHVIDLCLARCIAEAGESGHLRERARARVCLSASES